MIRLSSVCCAYEGQLALDSVTLEVRRGESIVILGPNGYGTSTLLKLISGVVPPTSGRYEFDGTELTRARLKDSSFARRFHQRVGFLFPSPDAQLFRPTVRDEVAFGPRQMGLPDEEVEGRVSDCMALLGIESLSSRAPWHLSEGKTVICATHDLASVDGIFRTAAVLSCAHRLVRAGPFDLLASDRAFMEARDLLEAGQK